MPLCFGFPSVACVSERTILLVEDEADIRGLIKLHLTRAGHRVVESDGSDIPAELWALHRPDLVLLDWMLPRTSGLEILRSFRATEATRDLPVLMLTARAHERDILEGLEAGADDYVTKPFSIPILLARVEACLRRAARTSQPAPSTEPFECGGLRLDPRKVEVTANGQVVSLTVYEFRILQALISQPDRVFTRQQLMFEAKGPGVTVVERTIDNHILGLRKKLSTAGDAIETLRGIGYRLNRPA